MLRLYREGKAGIILANSFESRWYTHNRLSNLLFDSGIIKLIENDELNKIERGIAIENYCDNNYGERDYWGDSTDLVVRWVEYGSEISVVYEDGWERLIIYPPKEHEVFSI